MEQLSIFKENKKINRKKSIILSASRMTDMPKFYPNDLISEVQKRIDKNIDIHTLVLWSKHPSALLVNPLNDYLSLLIKSGVQLYFQCTITGMGKVTLNSNGNSKGFVIEPAVPRPIDAIRDLEKVISLIGDPLRIKLRIDPIIKLVNVKTEETYTNLTMVDPIIRSCSKLGIKNFTFSFLENGIHQKVDRRFNDYEWKIVTPSIEEKKKAYEWLQKKADKYKVNISACCVSGLEESRCIDGYLLSDLRIGNKEVDLSEPRKRGLCACTMSTDIGGWPPKKCYSGCKYCYANAQL
ncbi:DUF1848 family protein [uncultured Clostridium sp.]|uniref:DUF1848 family protein n=1 Tax=uncultured Clostridium sp. TaxID=59620 RepID=UPI000822690A|nr:DUF1848 family protein [uncultured Clostridium sp.]SCJ84785.1 Domain of uncharacterised function (DUF1848) [uncultured Clostridium sp.]